jgi:hypothetical protein
MQRLKHAAILAGVLFLIIGLSLAPLKTAEASLVQVYSQAALNPNKTFDWGQLVSPPLLPGPDHVQVVNSGYQVNSTPGGNSATITATNPMLLFQDYSSPWYGFGANALVLSTSAAGSITFTFDHPVFGAGAFLQAGVLGDYVAHLEAFSGVNSLSTFWAPGYFNGSTTNPSAAIYLGFTGNEAVDRVEFWTTLSGSTSATVMGDLSVRTSAVPIPGGVWLFGSGLLGFFSFHRRLFSKK